MRGCRCRELQVENAPCVVGLIRRLRAAVWRRSTLTSANRATNSEAGYLHVKDNVLFASCLIIEPTHGVGRGRQRLSQRRRPPMAASHSPTAQWTSTSRPARSGSMCAPSRVGPRCACRCTCCQASHFIKRHWALRVGDRIGSVVRHAFRAVAQLANSKALSAGD